jgi:glycosyltransferase (activator-dependent family)
MRVLLTMWPAPAHLYPMMPLAWALQGAGHEVCVASAHNLAPAITAAGCTAVSLGTPDTTPDLDLPTVFKYALDEQTRNGILAALTDEPADEWPAIMFSTYVMTSMRMFHTPKDQQPTVPMAGVEDLVDFARRWEPDLVLWDPVWPSSAIAAKVCGAAHARQIWGPDYCGWATEKLGRLAASPTGAPPNPLAEMMRPIAERYGVEVDDELLMGQWTVDPTPPELRLPTGRLVVPVRRVPCTGTGVVPPWLYPVPSRPRVALSQGMSARKIGGQESNTAALLEAVGGLDIEVVATLDEVQLAGQKVPENVRTVEFVPLNQLLPTCAAVIHHGGGGTLTAAIAHKVPQLIETEGMESAAYARYLTSYRGGLSMNHREHSVAELRDGLSRVIEDPGFRAGTEALHARWLAMPSPNDVVPALEKLTTECRG